MVSDHRFVVGHGLSVSEFQPTIFHDQGSTFPINILNHP